jgi:hypothetical protein
MQKTGIEVFSFMPKGTRPLLILSVRWADYEELPTSADTIDYYGQTNRTVLVYLIEHVVIGSLNHCFFWGGAEKLCATVFLPPSTPAPTRGFTKSIQLALNAFWKPTD